jgi:LuxR family transcriptional regulator, maltose regulon positive regulatory protein
MAVPAVRSPSMVADRDVLLATKLHIPRPRAGLVSRARLVERLEDAVCRALVLVCTPAGFGKTTLLADWARSTPRMVAWLSLDQWDNDPARFWRHVAAALDTVRPGLAERIAGPLGSLPASFDALVATLVNELVDTADEVVLVLDDYHLIEAPEIHASLESLLAHPPSSLRLVLATRADPPLQLARLRASGQLTELREAELRFSTAEAAELLRTAVGSELPEAAVAALEERTEGWVAGLQLAGLSLQSQADVDAFVQTFSGSHRFVLDYLTEEVLDRQPAQLRQFLLETSILNRLSGPLADATTGRDDSQSLLEQIERANLFLTALDDVRGWWRYHHLFADLLRARLEHDEPQRVVELHRAAAAWYEQHNLIDDAIRHANAAGDATWAARLVEQHFEALLGRREDATVHNWMNALPEEAVRSRPRLCLAKAFWALIGGRLEAVETLLDAAERAFEAVGDEPYEPSVGRAASLVANVPAALARTRAAVAEFRGDAEQTLALTRQALAEVHQDEWMLQSLTRWYLAVAEWLRGRPAAAEHAFAANVASIAAWRTSGQLTLVAWGYYYLGQAYRAEGRLSAALATYQEMLEAVAGEPGAPPMPATGIAHIGMAEVHYERDDLDAALHHATQGVDLSRQLGWTLPLVAGLTILARIRQARGDSASAWEAIRAAEKVQLSESMASLFNPAPVFRARLKLANGDVDSAARWIQRRGLDVQDEPAYPHERDYLVLARVLLAQQAPESALQLLDRWISLAAAQERTESLIELQALQALAHAARHEEAAALAALTQALTLAAPERYLRVFIDEGWPMAAILQQLLKGQNVRQITDGGAVSRDYLTRLAAGFEHAGAPIHAFTRSRGVLVPGLFEPLSERELQVLGLLAAGKSNKAIAQELVVTLDTVKRHVTHVLDKLGAANRTQAVTRAQDLGLLP